MIDVILDVEVIRYVYLCQCISKKLSWLKLSFVQVFQVMAQADLGLADAYINGDFSFVDKDEGLLNLILVTILN